MGGDLSAEAVVVEVEVGEVGEVAEFGWNGAGEAVLAKPKDLEV